LTVKPKLVVLEMPPPTAVTVSVETPTVAKAEAFKVNVVEQVGLQDGAEKELVTPEGKPATEKATDWAVPDTNVAVTVLVIEAPRVTDLAPPLDSEKLKAGGMLLG
jgi:hypothetical protein